MHDPATILIVDDEPFNVEALVQELDDLGYVTRSASNGRAALTQVAAGFPDLILLDIMMPEMDGFQVLALLKADKVWRDVPVIVISAMSDLASVVKGIQLGAEDYLPKPFNDVLLRARIEAGLAKKHLRDQEREYLKQVDVLTTAAVALEGEVGSENSFDPDSLTSVAARTDGLGQLTRVFQRMTRAYQQRESQLKQHLHELRLEVDKAHQAQQVKQITGTDYFQHLRAKAHDLRFQLNGRDGID